MSGRVDDHARAHRYAIKTVWAQQFSVQETYAGWGVGGAVGAGQADSEQSSYLVTTNDEAYGQVDLREWLFDPARDIQVELGVTFLEAAKANVDFTCHVKGLANGEARGDCKVAADGSVTFAAMSNTDAGDLILSNRAALNVAGAFATENADGNWILDDEIMQFCVTCTDIGTATADNVGIDFVRFYGTMKLDSALRTAEMT